MRRPGLLARFMRLLARWLRGIAARLDNPYRLALAPAAFDALAHRFPDAPEHWLRDIADHVDGWEEGPTDEAGISGSEPEQTAPVTDASAPRFPAFKPRRPRANFQLSLEDDARRANRGLFHRLPLRRRPALRWLARAGDGERLVLEYSFSGDRPEAPLLWRAGPGRRARRLEASFARLFDRVPQLRPEPAPDSPLADRSPRSGGALVESRANRILALITGGPRRRHSFVGDVAETAPRPALHWPQPAAPSQPIEIHGAPAGLPARSIQTWTATDGVWPELPKADLEIADAAPNARALHDFNREQMAGLWSA